MRDGEQNANTGKVVAMASQKCTVTIGGLGDPAEHVVTVEGDTLYEAAVRGWKALRCNVPNWIPARVSSYFPLK